MDDIARIRPRRLCLSDAIVVGAGEGARWARVIGLALDGADVVATCEGEPQPVRLAGSVAIRVRRDASGERDTGDDESVEAGIATWYPGDLRAAGSAVLQHAAADRGPGAPAAPDDDVSHYSGLYGGDLDHVVDALGGAPGDLSPADLRAAAFQLRVAARRAEAAADAEEAEQAEDDADDHLSGPYSRDFQPRAGDDR